MNERWLVSSFTASSLIHLGIIPVGSISNARQTDQTRHGAHQSSSMCRASRSRRKSKSRHRLRRRQSQKISSRRNFFQADA